jgi:hypothetical protein
MSYNYLGDKRTKECCLIFPGIHTSICKIKKNYVAYTIYPRMCVLLIFGKSGFLSLALFNQNGTHI